MLRNITLTYPYNTFDGNRLNGYGSARTLHCEKNQAIGSSDTDFGKPQKVKKSFIYHGMTDSTKKEIYLGSQENFWLLITNKNTRIKIQISIF